VQSAWPRARVRWHSSSPGIISVPHVSDSRRRQCLATGGEPCQAARIRASRLSAGTASWSSSANSGSSACVLAVWEAHESVCDGFRAGRVPSRKRLPLTKASSPMHYPRG